MKRMKGWLIVVWIGLLVTGFCLNPAPIRAINLDFDVLGPNGTMSYAGGANPLTGDGILVDFVIGLDSPLHNGEQLTITNGELEFKTGNLTSSSTTEWDFGGGAGSFITIIGGIPVLGIPDGTALLSGAFGSASVFALGDDFKIVGGLFTDEKNATLTSYFGFGPLGWSGNFNISFTATGIPPGAFRSTQIESGDVGNSDAVPEPATMLLLGSGLLGLLGARKKFKK